MDARSEATWDGTTGTAGGLAFGAALLRVAAEKDVSGSELAAAAGLSDTAFERVVAGSERVAVSTLARWAHALKIRPIEFLQLTEVLSLAVYAMGLDPLYFLPAGQVRFDARIYMREINPRHRVPERDMFVRNPTLKALMADDLLDDVGKIEIELAYLLRAAIQNTGGSL
jgi:transcriptional regulator with XRE-family HTH domain